MESQWKFTTRGLFWSVFWMCVTCAAVGMVFRGDDHSLPTPLLIAVRAFPLVGPCIAIGALFGRALLGAVVSSVVVLLAIGLLMLISAV